MKTVLIVNPWIYDFAAYDLWMKPWGLLKIAAVLKRSGCKVFMVDAMDRHHPLIPGEASDKLDGTGKFLAEEIDKPVVLKGIPRKYKRHGLSPELYEKALPSEQFDAILVSSGMTYWYPGVFDAIRILKKRYSSPIILGGIYATLCYEHALRNSGADLVIKNGEYRHLAESLGVECDLSFRNILEETADLSFYEKNPYAVLRVSLGCPFNCSYCAQKLLSPGFMLKSDQRASSEIREFYKKGIRNFAFYDDALLFDNEYIEKYFTNIAESGIVANFYSPNGLHARFLSEKTAELMRKINFIDPVLSLETTDDEKGRSWHDKVTRNDFKKAVDRLNRAGYKQGEYTVYLMLGVPGSSFKDIDESMDFVYSLGCRISLSEYSPVPSTAFASKTEDGTRDPLLDNNSVFSFFSESRVEGAQALKDKANMLNSLVRQ